MVELVFAMNDGNDLYAPELCTKCMKEIIENELPLRRQGVEPKEWPLFSALLAKCRRIHVRPAQHSVERADEQMNPVPEMVRALQRPRTATCCNCGIEQDVTTEIDELGFVLEHRSYLECEAETAGADKENEPWWLACLKVVQMTDVVETVSDDAINRLRRSRKHREREDG